MAIIQRCPHCDAPNSFDNAQHSSVMACADCGVTFEVRPVMAKVVAKPRLSTTPRPTAEVKQDETTRSSPRRKHTRNRRNSEATLSSKKIILIIVGLGFCAMVALVMVCGLGYWVYLEVNRQADNDARLAQEMQSNRQSEIEEQRRNDEIARQLAVSLKAQETARQSIENVKRNDGPTRPPLMQKETDSDGYKPSSSISPNPSQSPPPRLATPPATEPPGPPLAKFHEPINPYKDGTQTQLRELRVIDLPKLPELRQPPGFRRWWFEKSYIKIAHSAKFNLLFMMAAESVWVYDLKTNKELVTQQSVEKFIDLSLAPDQSALYIADYGGEFAVGIKPKHPSWVHRFDLAKRTWEKRAAPRIAYHIEAVDDQRLLLLEYDQHVEMTLNLWEPDGYGISELTRISTGYAGDIEYDPRNGHVLYSNGIKIFALERNSLKLDSDMGGYGKTWSKGGGGTMVLSQDGSKLYYGVLQLNSQVPRQQQNKFPEMILAASRDIAFGTKGYYRASTTSKLGEYPFQTTFSSEQISPGYDLMTYQAVVAVSTDGMSVWIVDREMNRMHQFAIEGEKK